MIASRNALAATRRVAVSGSRSAARQSRRQARFNSNTTAGPSQGTAGPSSAGSSPLVAGLAGGGVVLIAGYGYYHLSGTKQMVDSAKSVHQSIVSAKDAALEKTPAPSEVIKYLRGVAKSYGGLIPGASSYIDASFDGIEELHQTHKDEVDAIVSKTYNDIKAAIQSGGMDAATAGKVAAILRDQAQQLGQLASKVGADVIGPVLDKHPEVKEKIGGGWSELKQVMQDAQDSEVAKQATSIYDDAVKQLTDIFNKGFSADSVMKAKALIEEKSKDIKDLSQKAAKTIWDKGQKEYGDKVPDEVKSLLTNQETVTTLLSGSGAMATVVAIWNRVKDTTSSKAGFDEKSVTDLKDFVQKKVQEAKDKAGQTGSMGLDSAWKAAESWLKTVPGGQKALDAVPDIDMAALSKIATSKGDDAKKLAEETYSDILKILKEKAEKAKKLGEDAKEDAKKEGSSGKKDGEEKKDGKMEESGKRDDKKEESGKKSSKK